MSNYKPPPIPGLLESLEEMSGCIVITNVNGGNPYGNNKYKKKKIDTSGNRKAHKRGANINLGHTFEEEKK